uniref:mucin-16-like isoform X1 n=1 Tax=Epinephelus lanceolatus TaxID=310571 RepID=UPI001447E1F7|nr:mucin-16-like isoform X1 [Epinephelus lanceolatus]XP_033470690.1 mucin-16-like isoform X1 [Epinephelus lanceolatus]XP_033470691.1 mucin-16-like isoform X1 [Epinephelus lanceolatus]
MAFSSDHNFTGNLEGQGENGLTSAPSLVDEQNLSADFEPAPVEPLCPGEPQNMMPATTQQAMPGNSQQIGHYMGMESQNAMGQAFSGPGGMGGGGGGIVVDQHGQYQNASMSQAANTLFFNQDQNGNMFYPYQSYLYSHNQQLCVLQQQTQQQQHCPNQPLNQHQHHQLFPQALPHRQHPNLSFDRRGQSQSQKQSRLYRQQVQSQLTARGSKLRSSAKQKKTYVDSQNASLNGTCLQPQQQGSYQLTRPDLAFSGSRLRVPQSCFTVHSSSVPHSLPLSATVGSTKACQPAQDPSYPGGPKIPSHSQQPLFTTSVSLPATSTASLTSTAPTHSGTGGQFPSTVSSTKACQPAQDPSYPGGPKIPSHSQQPLFTTSVSLPATSTASLTSTAPTHSGMVGQFPSTVSPTKACQPAQDAPYPEDPEIPCHSQQSLSTTSESVPTTSTATFTSTVPSLPGTEGQLEENLLQTLCCSGVSQANSSMASPLRPQSYGASLSLGDNLLPPDEEDLEFLGHPDLLADLLPQLKAPPSQQDASEYSCVQSSQESGHEHRTSPVGYKVEKSECSTSDGKSDCPTSQSEVATGTTPEVGFTTLKVRGTSPNSASQPKMPAPYPSLGLEENIYTFLESLKYTPCTSDCAKIPENLVKPGDTITDSCKENANPAPRPSPSGVPTNHTFSREQTLFIISQVQQHITFEGLGLPKNLAELNERLKSPKGSKKEFWMDLTEKLKSKFRQEFSYEKVNRKWNTLVEGYKKVKGNNKLTEKGTRFQFYAEMDALMDQNDEQNEVDPIIRTSEELQVCGPEALGRCSSVTAFAETTLSQATPRQLAAKRKPEPSATPAPEPSATPMPPCKRKKWEDEEKLSLREFNEECQRRHEEVMHVLNRQLDVQKTQIQLLYMIYSQQR